MTTNETISKIAEAIYKHGYELAASVVNPICRNKFQKKLNRTLIYSCASLILVIANSSEKDKLLKKELKNLVGIIFQPDTEEIYFDKINKPESDLNSIHVNLTHGWGAKVEDETLIDMFDLIEETEDIKEVAKNLALEIINKAKQSIIF